MTEGERDPTPSIECGARVMLRGGDGGATEFLGWVRAVNGHLPKPYVVLLDGAKRSREYSDVELIIVGGVQGDR